MKVVCVDDEKHILQHTISLCEKLSRFTEIKGFLRSEEALAWLKNHKADLAILDINMPDMNGLVLAAKIKEKYPDTAIIFLTSYAQYAVEAFQIHVSGYLLKPVTLEQLSKEVNFALSEHFSCETAHIFVRTFGNFDLLIDGNIVNFSRSKSKELLAYLVDRQGSFISRTQAASALWEGQQYDRPIQKQLDVIIRSMRSTLKEYDVDEIVEIKNAKLRIIPELLDCDMYRFLDGDIDAVNAYHGEYMNEYSWASPREAYIDRENRNRTRLQQ